MNTSSCIYSELVNLLKQHTGCVLATVVNAQGSTPQKAGSTALIGKIGLLAGTVGGGMTELKVIQQSQTLLGTKESGLYSFELHGEIDKGSESICGGSMRILVDIAPKMHLSVFAQLKNSLEQRIPGVLVTWIDQSDQEKKVISRYWFTKDFKLFFPGKLEIEVDLAVTKMLDHPNPSCRIIEMENQEFNRNDLVFLECIVPKPALVIAGAGHIGRSLAHLGKFLGFEVTVWDDRPEYANQNLITDADVVLSGTVEDSLGRINIQDDCYVVIVTRGHKSDADVLRKFIGSNAAYIGMIGSKAKVSQMKTSFLENGWATREHWDRIYSPIGLEIGSKTVEEIAVSIASQLVKIRNERKNEDG